MIKDEEQETEEMDGISMETALFCQSVRISGELERETSANVLDVTTKEPPAISPEVPSKSEREMSFRQPQDVFEAAAKATAEALKQASSE